MPIIEGSLILVSLFRDRCALISVAGRSDFNEKLGPLYTHTKYHIENGGVSEAYLGQHLHTALSSLNSQFTWFFMEFYTVTLLIC